MLTDKNEWVAVFTHPGAEMTVARHFEDASPTPIEYYLPMLANRDRRFRRKDLPEKPMFPCYIFAHINKFDVYRTRTIHGVIGIVAFNHSISTVSDREIEAVRMFEASQRKFYLHETTKLVRGARATILNGEFAGLQGTLVKGCKDGNFCVSIEVMNLSFVVRVKRSELIPAEGQE